MEIITYKSLAKDYFVYVPYVKTKINLTVNSLNYSIDALSMIVLCMKKDCKSDEEIAQVTNLNIDIIREIKHSLVKEGLLKEDYTLTESSIKILDIYDVINVLEDQLKECYSNLLLWMIEDNINEDALVKEIDNDSVIAVVIDKSGQYLENFEGAEEIVDRYLKDVKKESLAEHFEINKRIVDNKDILYLKKKIKRLPIIYEIDMVNQISTINENTEKSFTVALPCLQIEMEFNDSKSTVFYQEPFEGQIFETTRELLSEPNYAYLKFNNDLQFLKNSNLNLINLEKFLLLKYGMKNLNIKDLIKKTQVVECYFDVAQSVLGEI